MTEHHDAREAVKRFWRGLPNDAASGEALYLRYVQSWVADYLKWIDDPDKSGQSLADARHPPKTREALRRLATNSSSKPVDFDVARELVAHLVQRNKVPGELKGVALELVRGARLRPKGSSKKSLGRKLFIVTIRRAMEIALEADRTLTPTRNDEKVRDSAADIVAECLLEAGNRHHLGYAGVKGIWMQWKSRPGRKTHDQKTPVPRDEVGELFHMWDRGSTQSSPRRGSHRKSKRRRDME